MWDDTTVIAEHGFFHKSFQPNSTNEVPTGKKAGSKRTQNVVPVAIRMLRDFPMDKEFTLYKMPVQIVVVVGIVRQIEILTTVVNYIIQDHTGTIRAILWLENENATSEMLPCDIENKYVQLFGSVRSTDGKRTLLVLKMVPVVDADVITSHLLQVIDCRLAAERNSKNALVVPADNPGIALASAMTFMEDYISDPGQIGLNNIQTKIFNILKDGEVYSSGVPRAAVLKKFPPNLHKEVNSALEFLVEEGHAYSTIDCDHFKATAVF